MSVLQSAQSAPLEASDTPIPSAGDHGRRRKLIIWGGVLISLILIALGVTASMMAGERMSPQRFIKELKVAIPGAQLYSKEVLIASPSSPKNVQLVSSPRGYWSALGRARDEALQTSSPELVVLNGHKEQHLEPLVTLFSQIAALDEGHTQSVLGELTLLDERLTFRDLWVIAGSARESRRRREEALRPLRMGFLGQDDSQLQTITFEVSPEPINKIDGLKVVWGQQISLLTNLEGDRRAVGRLPARISARDLELRARELLQRLDWTQDYKWVSFEAPSDVMLSEFYTLVRLIYSLSGPGIAQRGGTPLQFIIHLKP